VFSEKKAPFALYNINSLVFITEVESVYKAVLNDALYNTDTFVFKGLKHKNINAGAIH
jgi:hypothetical protein